MAQLFWIFIWMGVGYGFRRFGRRLGFLLGAIDRFIIWVSLPATILFSLHRLEWSSDAWVPVSMAWFIFGGAVLFFSALGKIQGWSRHTVGALILSCGLGNTSFIGFPLLRALYGERAISIAVLSDQPGSFLVLSTVGIYCASIFSAKKSSVRTLCIRVFRFPPFWATLLAFGLKSVAFPDRLNWILVIGMKTLIPLALISVGTRLDFGKQQFERELSPLMFGLFYKLFIAPLAMTLFLVTILQKPGEMTRITLLEAAMGPMITGAIVAKEYELDPALCSLLVSVGIPLCLITVPIWAWVLQALRV